jgi:hypothetical protein
MAVDDEREKANRGRMSILVTSSSIDLTDIANDADYI